MKMKDKKRKWVGRLSSAAVIAAAATAATSAIAGTMDTSGVNGPNTSAVTISLSGSTAMRNFTIAPGFTLLNPGNSITLLSGPNGEPVIYQATSGSSTSVQLAPSNATSGYIANPNTGYPPHGSGNAAVGSATYGALRVEWHEQGSVEGINELADSQINDSLYANDATYNVALGGAIGVYVNRNKWGADGTANPGTPINNFQLNNFTSATDRSTSQTINRVQMAISDVNAVQGFSKSGGTGAYNKTPGQQGYGKGNPKLQAAGNTSGIGQTGRGQQLLDEVQLNMTTTTTDPATGASYNSGPWNSAGVGNLHNEKVAVTATIFCANPGTGMLRVNRSDAQWLQMTGRLANGADFNVTTRDVNSGTRNVASSNIGVDPSWTSGENDGGIGGGTSEDNIGPGIKFSNKSGGGANLRPTLQNSRMAFGHLGLSDARQAAALNGSRPLRNLDYRDDGNDLADAGGDPGAGSGSATVGGNTFVTARNGFTPANAYTIVNGTYAIWQNETYVTVKNVDAAVVSDFAADFQAREGRAPTSDEKVSFWSGKLDGPSGYKYLINDGHSKITSVTGQTTYGATIKGDNHNSISGTDYGNDVYDVRQNVLTAVANFPASSIANPADALLSNSFILPQFMAVQKNVDGVRNTFANPDYNAALSTTFLQTNSLTSKFDTLNPSTVTKGSSSTYGNVSPTQGSIAITDNGAGGGNWLFGNFRQNGIRDFAAIKAGVDAQKALVTSGLGTDMFAGAAGSNNAAVGGLAAALTGASKGDLIVLGDFDSNGTFDGKDLYLMARGAALADNTGTDQLTAASGSDFGDMLRKGVLRKNAALDYLDGQFTAGTQQRVDARASATNDPTGANAFNKRDVNRDGNVDFVDAVTSDKFFNQNYTNLDHQVMATGDVRVGDTPTPISLVDMELNDTGTIDQSDLTIINNALVGNGKETWTGTLIKSGAGTVAMAYTGGTFKVNTGAKLRIDAGIVNAGGSVDPFTDNTGTATAGNHLDVQNTGGMNITAGTKTTSALTGTGSTTIAAGATLSAHGITQSSLTVNGRAIARTDGTAVGMVRVSTLSLGGSAALDLNDNDLVVNAGNFSTLQGLVLGGYRGSPDPSATGIVSTTSQTVHGGTTILALFDNSLAGFSDYPFGSGQTIAANAIVGKYTYIGDTNYDGQVTPQDYTATDANLNTSVDPAISWFYGDTNFDGNIDASDYTGIDAALGLGVGNPLAVQGLAAVPEPSGLALLLGASGLLIRRRRVRI